jgi:hypothetical protein
MSKAQGRVGFAGDRNLALLALVSVEQSISVSSSLVNNHVSFAGRVRMEHIPLEVVAPNSG